MFSVMYFLRSFFKSPDITEDSDNKFEFNEDPDAEHCEPGYSLDQDEDYFETRSYFSESPSELKSEVFESVSDIDSVCSDTTDELNKRSDCLLLEKNKSVYSDIQNNIHSNTYFSRDTLCSQNDQAKFSFCSQTQPILSEKSLTSDLSSTEIEDTDKELIITNDLLFSDLRTRDDTENNNVPVNDQHDDLAIRIDTQSCVISTSAKQRGVNNISLSEGCLSCARSDTLTVAYLSEYHQSLPNIHLKATSYHVTSPIEYNNNTRIKETSAITKSFSAENLNLNTSSICLDQCNGILMRTSTEEEIQAQGTNYQEEIHDSKDWNNSSQDHWTQQETLPRDTQHTLHVDSTKDDGATQPDTCKHDAWNSSVAYKCNSSETTTKPIVPQHITNDPDNALKHVNGKEYNTSGTESQLTNAVTDSSNKPAVIIISIQRTGAQATINKLDNINPVEEQCIETLSSQTNYLDNSEISIQECSKFASNRDLDTDTLTNKDEASTKDRTEDNNITEENIDMKDLHAVNVDLEVLQTSQDKQDLQQWDNMLDGPRTENYTSPFSEEKDMEISKENHLDGQSTVDLIVSINEPCKAENSSLISETKDVALPKANNAEEESSMDHIVSSNALPCLYSEESSDGSDNQEFSFSDDDFDDENECYDSFHKESNMEDTLSSTHTPISGRGAENIDMSSDARVNMDEKTTSNIPNGTENKYNCEKCEQSRNSIKVEDDTITHISSEHSVLSPVSEIPEDGLEPVKPEKDTEINDNVKSPEIKSNTECKPMQSLKPPTLSSRHIATLCKDDHNSDLSDDELVESSFLYNRSMRKASGPGRIDIDNFTRLRCNTVNVCISDTIEKSQDNDVTKPQSESNDMKSNKNVESKGLKERLSWAHKSFSSLFDFKNLEKENVTQQIETDSKEDRKKMRAHQMSWRALRKSKERDSLKRLSVLNLSTHVMSSNKPRKPSKEKLEPGTENFENSSVIPDLLSSSPAEMKENNCTESKCDKGTSTNSQNLRTDDVDKRSPSKCGVNPRTSFEHSMSCSIFTTNEQPLMGKHSPTTSYSNICSNSDPNSMPCRPMSPKPQSQWPSYQRKSLRNSRASATSMTSLGNCSPMEGYLDSQEASTAFKPWPMSTLENEFQKEDSGISSQSQASIYTASSTSDMLRDEDNRPNQTTPIKMQREKILQKRKTSELLVFTFPNTDTANKTSTLPLLVSAGCRKNSEKRKTQLLYRSFSCDDLWVNQTKQSMNVNKSGVSIPAQNPTKNTQVHTMEQIKQKLPDY